MSATCPTRPRIDRAPRDGMIGMALFQGLLDREGWVLDKGNRFAQAGFAALETDAQKRAAIAFTKALEVLEAQEPAARIEEFQEAYAAVGSGLLRVGRIESAQTAATHALAANGGNLRALGLQGDILLTQERASDALGYYDAGLRIDPKAKDLWERKGDAHVALEQRPEAIRAYMQVVNLDPDDVEGYRRVLALVPDDAELWVRTGEAHRRRNELDEAQSAFDRALRINSECKEALEGKSLTYLAAGEPQRAVRTLAPRVGRLEALRSLARWDDIVKEASKVVSLEPRHAGALYAKAHACIQLNRREEALAALDGFLAVEPRSYDGLEAKRDLLLRTERWSDLVVACDAILAIQPHHPRALKDKGRALLALGKPEEAYTTFERLRVAAPDDLDALRGQRDALRHSKNAKVLLRTCEAILQKDPADAGTWTARGEARQSLNEPQDALT